MAAANAPCKSNRRETFMTASKSPSSAMVLGHWTSSNGMQSDLLEARRQVAVLRHSTRCRAVDRGHDMVTHTRLLGIALEARGAIAGYQDHLAWFPNCELATMAAQDRPI